MFNSQENKSKIHGMYVDSYFPSNTFEGRCRDTLESAKFKTL